MLTSNKDFDIDNFNIFRRIFSTEFNVTLNNKRSRSTSPKEEVVKVIFSANRTRGTRL